VGLGLWCYYHPAPLGLQADPAKPYEARPEWYFMFLFQLLRYFQGPYEVVGTFVLPLVFFLLLFFWPFLDRNPRRDPRRRPVALGLLGAGTAGLVGLTVYALATDVRMPPRLAEPEPARAAEPAGPIQRADVARIYNDRCLACHGVDGTGSQVRPAMARIPDFTSMAWQLSKTDLDIIHQIREGSPPLMPAYRDQLGEQQQLALAVYVRAFAVEPGEVPAGPHPAVPPPPVPTAAAQMSPEQIYRTYCLACHDGDGRGSTVRKAMPEVPDFADAKWGASRTDADLKQSILEGKGKFMLPMKDKLAPADAERMVGYVRAFQGGKQVVKVEPQPPPPPPAQPAVVPGPAKPAAEPAPSAPAPEDAVRLGAATGLFRQYCLVCHGTDGRGTALRPSMPTIPDFTNPAWQAGVSKPQLAASILEGKGTLMPSFRGRVSEAQARDLAAYVRAFGPERAAAREATPGDSDFEKRYRELEAEWEELQKQLRALEKPAKP
jgi:mono/diheme cytochrome c family protein